MTTEERLQQLIAAGAGFMRYGDATNQPLAAAHVIISDIKIDPEKGTPNRELSLWICTLWPENEFAQHWRSFAQVEDLGHALTFKTASGVALYDVAPLDPDELAECNWEAWQNAQSEHVQRMRAFVKQLELGIQNQIGVKL